MTESTYRILVRIALGLTVVFVSVSIYDCGFKGSNPGDLAYLEANTFFEDGQYQRSLDKYSETLKANPEHLYALRGKARSLMQLNRFADALQNYDLAIEIEPEFAATYANRGILFDRMGQYEKALADYEKAAKLDPKLNEGPHWLTRFLRNQADKPPGVADRAAYLREQLAKPPDQRILRMPEIDAKQRSYKQ